MPRTLVSVALAVAVLAGQWLAASHDSDHGLAPGAGHACAICVYAHGAGSGALPVTPALTLAFGAVAPEITAATTRFAASQRFHPIRGPPQLL